MTNENINDILNNIENTYGVLAQLGERYTGSVEVSGSIPLCSTKKSRSKERDFFIHCESNGISSRVSVYIIAVGVYHHTEGVH